MKAADIKDLLLTAGTQLSVHLSNNIYVSQISHSFEQRKIKALLYFNPTGSNYCDFLINWQSSAGHQTEMCRMCWSLFNSFLIAASDNKDMDFSGVKCVSVHEGQVCAGARGSPCRTALLRSDNPAGETLLLWLTFLHEQPIGTEWRLIRSSASWSWNSQFTSFTFRYFDTFDVLIGDRWECRDLQK